MNLLLDTNIISAAMLSEPVVMRRLADLRPGDAAISAVTYAEVRYGLQRMSSGAMSRLRQEAMARKEELFERLLYHIDVIPWDKDAAAAYAVERVACERDGETLDFADVMILAHASSSGRTLVTRDGALQRRASKGPRRTEVIAW